MSGFTRITLPYGRYAIRKDGKIIATLTPTGDGRVWLHYFGPGAIPYQWPVLCDDMDVARDTLKANAA